MPNTAIARAFAPATVGNIICGFDIFGLALGEPGDEVEAKLRDEPGVVISAVHGDGGRLPTEAARNVAGVATIAVLAECGMEDVGIEIEVWKGLPISGGMGGSAASAVAAVVAADALLQTGLSPEERAQILFQSSFCRFSAAERRVTVFRMKSKSSR